MGNRLIVCPRCTHELELGQSICSSCGFVLLNPSAEDRPTEGQQRRQENQLPKRPMSSRQSLTGRNETSAQNDSTLFLSQNQQYDQRPPLRATRFTTNTSTQSGPLQKQSTGRSYSEAVTPIPVSFDKPIIPLNTMTSPGMLLRESLSYRRKTESSKVVQLSL